MPFSSPLSYNTNAKVMKKTQTPKMSSFNPQNLSFDPQNQRNMNKNNNPVWFLPFKSQEVCHQFRMGNCSYGGHCKYNHHVEQRRTGMIEMGQFVEGQRMENKVVRNCKWSLGMCPYGERCVFGHKVELSYKRMLERPVDVVAPKRGCRMSAEGVDQMDCFKVREAVRKTKLCYKWEKFGSCPYGGACHFAHGREDIKQNGSVNSLRLEQNRAPGRTGSSSCYGQITKGKKTMFKWSDIEKISRIYADWIDLAPVS